MAEKRSTSAKKTTPTKKSTTTKATAPTRKATTTKKTASARTSQSSRTSTAKKPSAGTASSSGSSQVSAADVALSAAAQLLELTGRGAEGVTGIEKTEDGWRVQVEVVELRRIPETTDLLATYEVTMSDSGTMSGYRRLRRYSRGSTSDG